MRYALCVFDPVEGARHLVELLAAGELRRAARRYFRYPRNHMLPHRPAGSLQANWEHLTRPLGTLQRIEGVYSLSRTRGRVRSVVVRCRFARGRRSLELRYVPHAGKVYRFLRAPALAPG